MPVPALRQNVLARPRLDQLFRGALEQALTIVHAPLGYGKTVTTARALRDIGESIAWYDAQPWQHDAFLAPLINAIRQVRVDFGRRSLALASRDSATQRIAAVFVEELGHIDEDLIVVIDNAHIFVQNGVFSTFIDEVLPRSPSRVRFVVLSRMLPPLSRGELLLRTHAQMLTSSDLRFSAAEIAEYAFSVRRPIDETRAADIYEQTQGWPAAVELSLLYGTVPQARSDRPQDVGLTLGRHVLESLPSDAARFIERIAVYPHIDLAFFERAGLSSEMRDGLESLERSGILNWLSDKQFSLNPLVRAAVLAQGNAAHAHREAAHAYEAAGMLAAAFYHLQGAEDDTSLLRFLEEYAHEVTETEAVDGVASSIGRLRDQHPEFHALLRFIEALIEHRRGDHRARALLEEAASDAAREGNGRLQFAAQAKMVELDLAQMTTPNEQVISDLLERSHSQGQLAAATILAGWKSVIEGDFEGALQRIAAFRNIEEVGTRVSVSLLRAYVHAALGRVVSAQQTLDDLLHFLETSDRVILQVQALIWYGRLSLLWGDTSAALDYAMAAQRLSTGLEIESEAASLYGILAESHAQLGDAPPTLHNALETRRHADTAWYGVDARRLRSVANQHVARAFFLRGELTQALSIAERALNDHATPTAQRAAILSDLLIYASLANSTSRKDFMQDAIGGIARAEPADAADAVAIAVAADIVRFIASVFGDVGEIVTPPTVFGALIDHRSNGIQLALAGLALRNYLRETEKVTAFAAALELICSQGPRFEALLALALAASLVSGNVAALRELAVATHDVRSKFAPSVVALKPLAEHHAAPEGIASLGLTEREAGVLELLVAGLSNKELAQRLAVSPRTVETHVERILAKLEVSSRSRAIAKAVRLGLVSADEHR